MTSENISKDDQMIGKVVMITGANSGIGKETARVLAEMGASIVMLCRNRERGQAALQELRESTHSNNIELIIGDLADPDSIREAVSEFKARYKKLHVLINNAGLTQSNRKLTPSGYEMQFAVNHLGHFLLTTLLLDTLKESAPSRIINVSSSAHRLANFNFDDINQIDKYRGFRAYGNSKLANLWFTYELARRLEGTGVTVNALHPGFVRSNFGKGRRNIFIKGLFKFARLLFSISVEDGAKTSIYLAGSPEVEGVNGKYFVKAKPVKSSDESYDQESQKRLWELSEKIFKEESVVTKSPN